MFAVSLGSGMKFLPCTMKSACTTRSKLSMNELLSPCAKTATKATTPSPIMSAEAVAAVIRRVRERFPAVERVTTYGRAATLARRTPQQLALLVDAGLTRVHLGLESGADE